MIAALSCKKGLRLKLAMFCDLRVVFKSGFQNVGLHSSGKGGGLFLCFEIFCS